MEKEKTEVRGVRLKQSAWITLQEIADENEMGNLNHVVNKIISSHLKALGKKKK